MKSVRIWKKTPTKTPNQNILWLSLSSIIQFHLLNQKMDNLWMGKGIFSVIILV